jgi:adenine-specific DNA-methyltransferase
MTNIGLEYKQPPLFGDLKSENESFLSQQLITYIGNKRGLLNFIRDGLEIVKKRLGKKKISTFDVFSGSGIISRFLKQYSNILHTNDLEKYAKLVNQCYLTNKSQIDFSLLNEIYSKLLFDIENNPLKEGFIRKLYSPNNDDNIQIGERVFYTRRNAQYIDTMRQLIAKIDDRYQHYFLAPLLSEASIHANTSGVFKGFYKCKKTGIGKFGGSKSDALFRIKGDIKLPFPVFSNFECEYFIHHGDSNKIADKIPEVDLAYLDPPYNQHPYGSNYFMLNLIIDYNEPKKISKISGIPINWNRSSYNKKANVYEAFIDLLNKLKAKYLLISFNSEGFITIDTMLGILNSVGKVTVLETKYNTFRGSRNLRNRNIHVKEFLYLVEKS